MDKIRNLFYFSSIVNVFVANTGEQLEFLFFVFPVVRKSQDVEAREP